MKKTVFLTVTIILLKLYLTSLLYAQMNEVSPLCPGNKGYYHININNDGTQVKGGFVSENAKIGERVTIHEQNAVCDFAELGFGSVLDENAIVRDNAILGKYVVVGGEAIIAGNAKIGDHARIGNEVIIAGNSIIDSKLAIWPFKPIFVTGHVQESVFSTANYPTIGEGAYYILAGTLNSSIRYGEDASEPEMEQIQRDRFRTLQPRNRNEENFYCNSVFEIQERKRKRMYVGDSEFYNQLDGKEQYTVNIDWQYFMPGNTIGFNDGKGKRALVLLKKDYSDIYTTASYRVHLYFVFEDIQTANYMRFIAEQLSKSCS